MIVEIGTIGHVSGYRGQYEVVGEWRGYLTVLDRETDTSFKVRPADFTSLDCGECGEGSVWVEVEDHTASTTGAYTLVCPACQAELHVPAESKSRSRIGAVRAIVRDHKAARVDGYIVDAQTAGLLVKVYEALSPANREKFGKPDLGRLVDVAWKCAR